MFQFLLGTMLGVVGGYLYGSERAREAARQRFAAAPEPLRRATQTVATSAAGGAQRLSGAIASAPVPDSVKGAASSATSTVQSALGQAGQSTAKASDIIRPTDAEISGRPTEPLPRIEPEP